MQFQGQHIDIRTRRRMTQLRTILKMRLSLLEKDIGFEKKKIVHNVIDELSLNQLNKLRNVTDNIANEILATYNKESATEE